MFSERKQWTVSELTRYIRQLFELDYRLQDLEVEGEVSNFRVPGSGHAYFTIKDADSQLKCVLWGFAKRKDLRTPASGDRIVARGYLGIYEPSGEYQLYCRHLRPAGIGDLHAEFEALKARLQAEGLFDASTKAPLPEVITTLGVVTSPSTAALQDVLNILKRRNPLLHVILSPAPVQGEQAPPQIIAALQALAGYAGHRSLDAIILVRGGGSMEDLWCFNDEALARAIARVAVEIPLISGVGHEIDFTLADFAASVRAPTPSAAAELVTPVTHTERQRLVISMADQIRAAFEARLAEERQQITWLARSLRQLSPSTRVNRERQTLDMLSSRITRAASAQVALRRARLQGIGQALAAFNPRATLARGYSITYGPDGAILRDVKGLTPGDKIRIHLDQGQLEAAVETTQDR